MSDEDKHEHTTREREQMAVSGSLLAQHLHHSHGLDQGTLVMSTDWQEMHRRYHEPTPYSGALTTSVDTPLTDEERYLRRDAQFQSMKNVPVPPSVQTNRGGIPAPHTAKSLITNMRDHLLDEHSVSGQEALEADSWRVMHDDLHEKEQPKTEMVTWDLTQAIDNAIETATRNTLPVDEIRAVLQNAIDELDG